MRRDQPDRLSSDDQAALFERIRNLVLAARKTVARGVDLVQVQTYFLIGQNIVEQEQAGEERAAYGHEVLKALAERLTAEFGRGFSRANLEYMRKFFCSIETAIRFPSQRLGNSNRLQAVPAVNRMS